MSSASVHAESDPGPITAHRIGFSIYDGSLIRFKSKTAGMNTRVSYGKDHSMSWPLGKLALYQDWLIICGFPQEYVLDYAEIEEISRFLFFNIRIKHRSRDVPKNVFIWGWGIVAAIKNAKSRARLRFRCKL